MLCACLFTEGEGGEVFLVAEVSAISAENTGAETIIERKAAAMAIFMIILLVLVELN
jgi:hypothetical protein